MRHIRFVLALLVLLTSAGLAGVAPAAAAPSPWWADYFANATLSGAPLFSRQDPAIDFDWGGGNPGGGLPNDNFSVRWSSDQWFAGGTYRFFYSSDDGLRIRVGDTLVVDKWQDSTGNWGWVDQYVAQGTVKVVVEYYEHAGAASVAVDWAPITGGETWLAEYFNNRNLSGFPTVVRSESAIDFDWGNGSPDPSIPVDNFSARWTRILGFTAGTYRFLASCDDGVRISVDGQWVVNAWQTQQLPNTRSGDITLTAGQHTIIVEYFEQGGEASAHVWWGLQGAVSGWDGLYYDNPDLVGGPALTRGDAEINFDWGDGPPVDWMPSDNFSVRWTRTVTFNPGYYVFKLQSDDGLRFWLDDALLIDLWQPMQGELHYLDGTYVTGPHQLKVEYYDRNGRALVHFWWEPSTANGGQTGAATPTPTPAPFVDPWLVELYANPSLSGAPAVTRIDTSLGYDWGQDAPAAGLPADGFSARWTQDLYFSGAYRFVVNADGGVRLWVDDALLIDAWYPQHGSRAASVWLAAGVYTVRMEYFDRPGQAAARLSWQRTTRSPGVPALSDAPALTGTSWERALSAWGGL